MPTIPWDPREFAVAAALDSGCKCNARYYVSEVPTPLSEWWRERIGGSFRKLIVHADNPGLHKANLSQQFMAGNALVIAANAAYSPDLAPSAFYLFGHMKEWSGKSHSRLGSDRYLRSRVFSIPRKVDLIKVFLEWMRRPEQYIETDGDYVG
jgi:hypothetical protein